MVASYRSEHGPKHKETDRLRILFLDDTPSYSEPLCNALREQMSCDTYQARSVDDALQITDRSGGIDLIVMDICIPTRAGEPGTVAGGLYFLQQLHERAYPRTKIMILSRYQDPNLRYQMRETYKVLECVPKPQGVWTNDDTSSMIKFVRSLADRS